MPDILNSIFVIFVNTIHITIIRVSEETAIRYLKELSDKYAPGSIIADVPSNRTGVNKGIFDVNGDNVLRGEMILEVPVQKKLVPKSILKYAQDKKIQIRDINGNVYK